MPGCSALAFLLCTRIPVARDVSGPAAWLAAWAPIQRLRPCLPLLGPSPLQHSSAEAGGKPAAAAAKLADRADVAARQAGDALTGAASEATAAAANVFLAEGGERQRGEVPPEVAEATAARSGGAAGAGAGPKKED
ncbi:hypothetical protein ABPG75_013864 [Micractinium tetrahymenae]